MIQRCDEKNCPDIDSIIYWDQSPSVLQSDKIFLDSLLSTLSSARGVSLLKLATIYRDTIAFIEDINALIKISQIEVTPLFQKVPAPFIQIVTNGINSFLTNMDQNVSSFIEYFHENPEYSGVFATLSFPSIFFDFITADFLELGYNFIEKAISTRYTKFTMLLMASYFDCYPFFTQCLWSEFDENSKYNSVYLAFIKSLPKALSHLTIFHKKLITHLLTSHRTYALQFFFTFYFPMSAEIYFQNPSDPRKQSLLSQILSLFNYAVNFPQDIIATTFCDSLVFPTVRQPYLSTYSSDILLPTVYCILSGCEVQVLFQAFKHIGIIKKNSKVGTLSVPSEHQNSLVSGYVQYTHRKLLVKEDVTISPLIFNSFEINKIDSGNYKRQWEQLKQMAGETGQTLLSVMSKPQDPKITKTLNSIGIIHQEDFQHYSMRKMLKMYQKSGKSFEMFIIWKYSESQLNRIKEIYCQEILIMLSMVASNAISSHCETNNIMAKIQSVSTPDPVLSIYNGNINSPFDLIPIYTLRPSGTFHHCSFFDIVSDYSPTTTPNVYSFLFALELANVWPHGIRFIDEFDCFIKRFQVKNLLGGRYDWIMSNVFLKRFYYRISEISSFPVGKRIKLINQIIEDMFLYVDHCVFVEGKERISYIGQLLLECLLMARGKDVLIDMIWFDRIATIMPACVNEFCPWMKEIWTVMMMKLLHEMQAEQPSLVPSFSQALVQIPSS